MVRRRRHWRAASAAAIAVALASLPAAALTLDLPARATPTGEDDRAADRVLFPVGPRTGSGGAGLVAEGRIARRAWAIADTRQTPFQLMQPLRDQLLQMGFAPRYECRDRDCGGFDFRLALDLLGAPAMHVDLGDFHYFTAEREGAAGAEVVSLVTSRSVGRGHIHLSLVTPTEAPDGFTARTVEAPAEPEAPPGDVARSLEETGHAVLGGLVFRPGSSELGEGPFAAITELAAWLGEDPSRRLVLVGHSDNVGGLDDNIGLSQRRAAAVAETLVGDYGISRSRIAARGVGYLAPIASNETPEGRRLNRRVEAVVGAP